MKNQIKIASKGVVLWSVIAGIFILTAATGNAYKQKNPKETQAPSVSFTVRTVTDNGPYSPKHVLAIWVENTNSVFVKTRKVMANARKQHLVAWMASSNNNVVDAITGSTLTSHTTHTVIWDCKDVNGNIVPDGDYKMRVEFTDRNSNNTGVADGPTTTVVFTKGAVSQNITPADETYFKDMSLTFTPDMGVGMPESGLPVTASYKAYPNPFSEFLNMECSLPEASVFLLAIYAIDGRLIRTIHQGDLPKGLHKYRWDGTDREGHRVQQGIYILKAERGSETSSWKVICNNPGR